METIKMTGSFYLFKAEVDGKTEYIQHIVSPSHDRGLTRTGLPEYAWKGEGALDVAKMKYLISISKYQKEYDWVLVRYNMEYNQRSWSSTDGAGQTYENVLTDDPLQFALTPEEQEELGEFKLQSNVKYGNQT